MSVSRHRLFRVTDFRIVGDYTIQIYFNDGMEQTINFEEVLYGPVFGPLRNLTLFNQVKLVDYAGCLEWPTGADFDPETLHDWPQYKDEIVERRKVQAGL